MNYHVYMLISMSRKPVTYVGYTKQKRGKKKQQTSREKANENRY